MQSQRRMKFVNRVLIQNLVTIIASLGVVVNSQEIHVLHPKNGSNGHRITGISCHSWQYAVETNTVRNFKTVPRECETYIGHYMLGHLYRDDSRAVVDEAISYVQSLKMIDGGKKNVWIFDIDETALSNLPYYARSGFGVEPFNVTAFNKWVKEEKAPALPETLRLYQKVLSLGIKVIFITGRSEFQRKVTAINLKHSGFHSWESLILRKPEQEDLSAIKFKSDERTRVEEKEGYTIIGNIGDQWSDILGSKQGKRTFKLPDPMYYIS